MDIKTALTGIKNSAKFEGVHIHLQATEDSRLQVRIDASGSVDLPGDLDAIVANIGGLLGLGNSQAPSTSSAG